MSFTPYKKLKHYGIGKRAKRDHITEKEAIAKASDLLHQGRISTLAGQLLNLLASAGVLTTAQLMSQIPLSDDTLNNYYKRYYLNHMRSPLSLDPFALPHFFNQLRLYTLGMVGQAIMEMQGRQCASYTGYSSHQITHDVLCNQVALNLIEYGKAQGYTPIWYGKYEARVYGQEGGKTKCVLEPDALLIFSKPNQPKCAFAIEYHNEDHRNRARDKVDRYEREARNQYWRDTWPLDDFPIVLAAFTHKAVATGYREAIAEVRGRGLRCHFLGKQFAVADPEPQRWWSFDQKSMIHLFDEGNK